MRLMIEINKINNINNINKIEILKFEVTINLKLIILANVALVSLLLS